MPIQKQKLPLLERLLLRETDEDHGLTLEEIIKQAADYAKQIAAEANKQAADIVEQAKAKDKAIREALSENLNKSLSEAAEVLTKSLKDVNTTRDAVSKIGAAEK